MTPVESPSTIPTLKHRTNTRLNFFSISKYDIFLIINNLDASKAYGWETISIRRIKLCDITIAILSKLIFKSILEEGTFPDDWKKKRKRK